MPFIQTPGSAGSINCTTLAQRQWRLSRLVQTKKLTEVKQTNVSASAFISAGWEVQMEWTDVPCISWFNLVQANQTTVEYHFC